MKYEPNTDPIKIPTSDMEQDIINETQGKNEAKKADSRRSVHVHSRRHRLADVEGLSVKAVLDALVSVGIFRSDKTSEIKEITYSQEKIDKTEEEETIITILWNERK